MGILKDPRATGSQSDGRTYLPEKWSWPQCEAMYVLETNGVICTASRRSCLNTNFYVLRIINLHALSLNPDHRIIKILTKTWRELWFQINMSDRKFVPESSRIKAECAR
jgi:hypothetical protein